MFDLFIDDAVTYDIIDAVQTYHSYFARHGEPQKGEEWADRFLADYLEFLASLQADPFAYPPCRVYPFDEKGARYRSHAIGWFTALFTVEGDEVCLWRVMNSRSDFSGLRTR